MWAIRGSPAGMHSTLSSPPASSRMRNIPIARDRIRHPGKVGSSSRTSASSGSPSSPSVPSMNPYSCGQRAPPPPRPPLEDPVVGRVGGGGEEHPVEPYPPGGVIHLVLVPLPHGDL